MNSSPSNSSKPAFSFPGWSPALAADDSLTAGLREGYRQTLSRFLRFCAQRQAGPSVAIAREFVELARLEQSPSPARLQEWKAALNWYFQRGREARAVMLKGVPPLARSDLGGASWEVALIAYLRQKGRSWRTEQTYRGWMWRFVKWLEGAGRGKTSGNARPHPSPLPQGEGGGSHGVTNPTNAQLGLAEAGGVEIREFLSMLAVQERVGVATQNQALGLVES